MVVAGFSTPKTSKGFFYTWEQLILTILRGLLLCLTLTFALSYRSTYHLTATLSPSTTEVEERCLAPLDSSLRLKQFVKMAKKYKGREVSREMKLTFLPSFNIVSILPSNLSLINTHNNLHIIQNSCKIEYQNQNIYNLSRGLDSTDINLSHFFNEPSSRASFARFSLVVWPSPPLLKAVPVVRIPLGVEHCSASLTWGSIEIGIMSRNTYFTHKLAHTMLYLRYRCKKAPIPGAIILPVSSRSSAAVKDDGIGNTYPPSDYG